MSNPKTVICIGSVLWDVIGRTNSHPGFGGDVGVRIKRLPGGVAMNIAMTLSSLNIRPLLLTAIGTDEEGENLIRQAQSMGMDTDYVYRPDHLRTDIYMAIECGQNGLVAALADAHSLEAAGNAILTPLLDGELGSGDAPFAGTIVLDGNLTADLLAAIAGNPALAKADLRVAPASPGKAARLAPLAIHKNVTVYVNLEEARTICDAQFNHSRLAAQTLVKIGFSRAMVSDGAGDAAFADHNDTISDSPPTVQVLRVTGAGDTLMAAHIAAELDGATGKAALKTALATTAAYISGPNK